MNFKLDTKLQSKWLENQLAFLKPLGIFVGFLYVSSVLPKIELDGFQISDLAITSLMITSTAMYIFNGLYDYFRKLQK